MKDTYYFSHDYNAREDEKVKNLIFELGMEGYGLYWALVESLYQNEGYLQMQCKRIAHELHTEESTINALINNFGLFETHENLFFSKSVLHRLKKRKGKTLSARKAAKIRWEQERQRNTNAEQPQSNGNAIKESKVKDIKGNKSKRKKEEAGDKSPLLSQCNDIYNEFIKGLIGMDAKFDGSEVNAMKSIITYLKQQCKKEEDVAPALETIFNNWYKLEPFIAEQITLKQINSNLIKIIKQIKHGTGKTTKGIDPERFKDKINSKLEELGYIGTQ